MNAMAHHATLVPSSVGGDRMPHSNDDLAEAARRVERLADGLGPALGA